MAKIQHKDMINRFYEDVDKLNLRFPVADIERVTGFSRSDISLFLNKKKAPSKNFLKTFYEKLDEFKSDEPDSREVENIAETVLLLPISAQAGSLNDFFVSVKDSDCERIISPIKGADFALTVSGESMSPEYPSGSQILIKKIDEKAFIDWGKVYVLDTCNGTIIKKLMPGSTEGKVLCVSINPEFPSYEVALDVIFGFYRIMLCMSIK